MALVLLQQRCYASLSLGSFSLARIALLLVEERLNVRYRRGAAVAEYALPKPMMQTCELKAQPQP